jgi:hypothetical protein
MPGKGTAAKGSDEQKLQRIKIGDINRRKTLGVWQSANRPVTKVNGNKHIHRVILPEIT